MHCVFYTHCLSLCHVVDPRAVHKKVTIIHCILTTGACSAVQSCMHDSDDHCS